MRFVAPSCCNSSANKLDATGVKTGLQTALWAPMSLWKPCVPPARLFPDTLGGDWLRNGSEESIPWVAWKNASLLVSRDCVIKWTDEWFILGGLFGVVHILYVRWRKKNRGRFVLIHETKNTLPKSNSTWSRLLLRYLSEQDFYRSCHNRFSTKFKYIDENKHLKIQCLYRPIAN